MKLPILNLGLTLEAGVKVCPDHLLEIPNEAYWRQGIGGIGGREFNICRRKSLGEFEYRLGESIILAPEYWNASEYMEWRDS